VKLALAHTRTATLQLIRYPSFSVPTVLFPTIFFLFFAAGRVSGPEAGIYVASFVGFGILGVAFFQFGVGIAIERTSPWELYLRTLPLPLGARFGARVLSALLFASAASVLVAIVALVTTPVALSPARWLLLGATALLASIPFGLLGIALGYWISPRGALPLANLLYLSLSFAGGLWTGRSLPHFVAEISPYLPTRQFAEVLWSAAGGSPWPDAAFPVLGLYSVLFAALAWIGYRRDEGEKFG
jgi:ABC-2 type transport system permease protein